MPIDAPSRAELPGDSARGGWILYDAAVFTAFYALFFYILKCVPWTDFPVHMQIIQDQIKAGDHFAVYMALPRYFYQIAAAAAAPFGGQLGDQAGCTVLILSVAVYLKYLITRKMMRFFIPGLRELTGRAYSFSLAFAAPVALGMSENTVHRWTATLPIACWHNITIIFCAAFSLALFWFTVRWVRDGYKDRDFACLCIFLVLSLLAKPSYMFAYLPAYCVLMLLYRPKSSRVLLLACIPVVLAGAAFFIVSKQMESFKVMAYGTEVRVYGKGIYWAPFEYYLYHLKTAREIATVHFCSVLLPVATALYFGAAQIKKIRQGGGVVFTAALLQFAFGVLAAYLFNMGSGDDRFHGNMTWQVLACNYIVFTLCIIELLKNESRAGARAILCVYCLHVMCGVVFVAEMFRTKSGWVDPLIGWWTKPG